MLELMAPHSDVGCLTLSCLFRKPRTCPQIGRYVGRARQSQRHRHYRQQVNEDLQIEVSE